MLRKIVAIFLAIVASVGMVMNTSAMNVQLPFQDGNAYVCTQGAGGSYSHFYSSTKYDLDFGVPKGTIIVAAAAGTAYQGIDLDKNGKEEGFGRYVKVDHGNGYWTMYGHLSGHIIPYKSEGVKVVAGQPLAYSGGVKGDDGSGASTGAHLHFGVHSGGDVGISNPMTIWSEQVGGSMGWRSTSPLQFSCGTGTAYRAAVAPGSKHFNSYNCSDLEGKQGVVCWSGTPFCEDGLNRVRYYRNDENQYTSSVANQDWCDKRQSGNTNVFAYLKGGEGVGGMGPGGSVLPTDTPIALKPDFIVKDVRLHTPWGLESYKYGLLESINTKAQSGNTGEGSCLAGESSTIIGHFYLSKGYKEDAHGDWRKVDSTETKCSNLKPGDTNTETKNTVISDWITTPGIYNIVYCIDHPKTEQNNGGDHAEKHESNNCSTEAVFEVTGNSYENTTNIDLVASQLQFRGTPPVYAADSIRLGAWITNAGTQGLYTDIRSSYGVSCNGSPPVQLADDGTEANLLGPGMNAWEEILSPATLPNVSGSCVATFCADHAYMVNEVNKANNCTSLGFNLAVRPQKPILSITKFQDEESCCTTNTGSRIKPNIWVKNSGPVAPATNVQVLYQVSSPVATGNQWVYIGYGIIEPRELPPGKTDEDYMEGSGFTIPKDNAWKLQWHQVRACIKPDGSAPSGDTAQGDICATYQRYSKK